MKFLARLLAAFAFPTTAAVAAPAYYTPVPTIAALVAYGQNSPAIAHASVASFYANGITGGGQFDYYDSCPVTADSGIAFHVTVTGHSTACWLRLYTGPTDLMFYGPVDAADDTTQARAWALHPPLAIGACITAKSDTITFTGAIRKLTIAGLSPGCTKIQALGNNDLFAFAAGASITDFQVTNISLIGPGAGVGTGSAIHFPTTLAFEPHNVLYGPNVVIDGWGRNCIYDEKGAFSFLTLVLECGDTGANNVDMFGGASNVFGPGTYMHGTTPGDGFAGYRVHHGNVSFSGANGVDGGDWWGIFSDAAGPCTPNIAFPALQNYTNVESFAVGGIENFCGGFSMDGGSAIIGSGTNVIAFSGGTSGGKAGFIEDYGKIVLSGGASWLNGVPLHTDGTPPLFNFIGNSACATVPIYFDSGSATINASTHCMSYSALNTQSAQVNGPFTVTGALTGAIGSAVQVKCSAYSGSTNDSSSGSGAFINQTPSCTIPANTLTAGRALRMTVMVQFTTGSAAPSFSHQISVGSTVLFTTTGSAPTNSVTNRTALYQFLIAATAAPSAASALVTSAVVGTNNSTLGSATNNTAQPVNAATNGALVLQYGDQWSAAGTGTNTATVLYVGVEVL